MSREDRVFPIADGRRLARDLRDARFELIDGARTFSMEEQPERLAALIRDFMTTTPAARGALGAVSESGPGRSR